MAVDKCKWFSFRWGRRYSFLVGPKIRKDFSMVNIFTFFIQQIDYEGGGAGGLLNCFKGLFLASHQTKFCFQVDAKIQFDWFLLFPIFADFGLHKVFGNKTYKRWILLNFEFIYRQSPIFLAIKNMGLYLYLCNICLSIRLECRLQDHKLVKQS